MFTDHFEPPCPKYIRRFSSVASTDRARGEISHREATRPRDTIDGIGAIKPPIALRSSFTYISAL